MAPSPSPSPSTSPSTHQQPWSPLTTIFLTLFLLTLITLLTLLTISSYLHAHKKKQHPLQDTPLHVLGLDLEELQQLQQQQPFPNPYPLGTTPWLAHENAQAPRSETDALTIASMQAQIRMLEDSGDILEHCVEVLQQRNRELRETVRELRRSQEETRKSEESGEGEVVEFV